NVRVPPDASASSDSLKLILSAGEGTGGGSEQTLDLQPPFVVERVQRVLNAPNVQFPQNANFGNLIELVGYDFSAQEIKPGETVTITLYWKALGVPEKPYTAFVHLLDKESKPQAQRDAQPLNGGRPTQTWVTGEFLTDPYPVEINAQVPPGEYAIEIGWYDAADPAFARLQVMDEQGSAAGDHVILQESVIVK